VLAVLGGILAAQEWCRAAIADDETNRAAVSRSVDITRQVSGR
jgi:hypothetical protein